MPAASAAAGSKPFHPKADSLRQSQEHVSHKVAARSCYRPKVGSNPTGGHEMVHLSACRLCASQAGLYPREALDRAWKLCQVEENRKKHAVSS